VARSERCIDMAPGGYCQAIDVAVITGAGRGAGAAIASRLAVQGMHVVVADMMSRMLRALFTLVTSPVGRIRATL
jgi:NAD(P)-dependent dehydrogenase (short-subunit alcohol dehydrogenase family)